MLVDTPEDTMGPGGEDRRLNRLSALMLVDTPRVDFSVLEGRDGGLNRLSALMLVDTRLEVGALRGLGPVSIAFRL